MRLVGNFLGPGDDDTRVDHSDVTATSSKLPYKAAFPPDKGIKKKLWSIRFFRFVYLFRHRHVILTSKPIELHLKMCGPPDVPTLLLFAGLDQKTGPAGFQTILKTGWTTSFF